LTHRSRNLIGTILLLLIVIIYALGIMATAPRILPDASPVVEFFFYLIAGLAWVPPAGLVVTWMARP
jgi:hypothetical protein